MTPPWSFELWLPEKCCRDEKLTFRKLTGIAAEIRLLQRKESKIVIETVADDLTKRFPNVFFVTLHDAVCCTTKHLTKGEAASQRAFDQSGFPMKLKIEH